MNANKSLRDICFMALLFFGLPMQNTHASCQNPVLTGGSRISESLEVNKSYPFPAGQFPKSLTTGRHVVRSEYIQERIYQKASLIANGNRSWWAKKIGYLRNEYAVIRVRIEQDPEQIAGEFMISTAKLDDKDGWRLVSEEIITLQRQTTGREQALPARNATAWSRMLEGNNTMFDYFTPLLDYSDEFHLRLYVRERPVFSARSF